jgi:leucyl/phenylalanyl-tRNA---protein transferase
VKSDRYRVSFDADFAGTMRACAATREQTWINDEIYRLYTALSAQGYAHSVECWDGDAMVGGLYGVSLGGAFFGESMFSTARDASKVALVHLVAQLKRGGYTLLDTQFLTTHLAQFGAYEIPRASYLAQLDRALDTQAYWLASAGRSTAFSVSVASGETGLTGLAGPMTTVSPGATALQVITQAS